MGEPLDLSGKAIPVEHLDRLDGPRVKLAGTLLQEAAVRDLARQCVRLAAPGVLVLWTGEGRQSCDLKRSSQGSKAGRVLAFELSPDLGESLHSLLCI